MDGIIENLYINRELYYALLDPLCVKYRLTRTELLILLFLAKNTPCDTASDIVGQLKIAKSHVSASVRDLAERGYLEGSYAGDNHRSIHLRLCRESRRIVQEGRKVQEEYLEVLGKGFTEAEKSTFQSYIRRMNDNANNYFREQLKLAKGADRRHE